MGTAYMACSVRTGDSSARGTRERKCACECVWGGGGFLQHRETDREGGQEENNKHERGGAGYGKGDREKREDREGDRDREGVA